MSTCEIFGILVKIDECCLNYYKKVYLIRLPPGMSEITKSRPKAIRYYKI